ncbi:hypothetical protein GCM10009648_16160 [Tsukamurella spumae]
MLFLHPQDEGSVLRGPARQQRPHQLVLADVVVMQAGEQFGEPIDQVGGARSIAVRHSGYEAGQGREVGAEDGVDDDHLLGLRAVLRRRHGDSFSVGAIACRRSPSWLVGHLEGLSRGGPRHLH